MGTRKPLADLNRRTLLISAFALAVTPVLVNPVALAARPARRANAAHARESARHVARPRRTHARPVHRPPPRRLPPAIARDHRWARPHPAWVRVSIAAHHPPSPYRWYRPWYTRWWVHPYYRWRAATWVVVPLGFAVLAWDVAWVPPVRAGWVWVPGHQEGPYWVPGHWTPVAPAPAGYVYVPGWWRNDVYVEGYWSASVRPDGAWAWVEGHYNPDGSYVWGHWSPDVTPPTDYAWEPGFWDGEEWVEGFWRPLQREGYTWVPSRFEADGTYNAGYWMPTQPQPGYTWVPGWFDGKEWIAGYWVPDAEYQAADPEHWEPEEGWDDGRTDTEVPVEPEDEGSEAPLALPIEIAP